MADQFCRIVDTTLTDSTLGSDATQAVITTDSSTSFIIRDVYKTDNCTSSSFNYKLDLELDGHKVHTDLATSASGTFIVPPSSTLCVKDTTGNYPLKYSDSTVSKLTYYCTTCADDFWTGLCINRSDCFANICRSDSCAVNGIEEAGATLPVLCGASHACSNTDNNNIGQYGSKRITNNCSYLVSTFENCNCTDRYFNVSKAYCNCCICHVGFSVCQIPMFQDDILIFICGSNCLRAWDMSANQDAWNCGITTMNCCRNGAFCAYYCCGRHFLSTAQKGCFACRIFTTPGCNGADCRNLTTFNLCSGNVCCIGRICRENESIVDGSRNTVNVGAYWSEKCQTWIAVFYKDGGFCSLSGAGIITMRQCDCCYRCICTVDFTNPFIYNGACMFNDTIYFRDSACCLTSLGNTYALYSMLTEDYATGITDEPTVELFDETFFKDIVLPTCYGGTDYCIKSSVPDAATITSRGYSIAPSSKLTVYGIKST